METVGIDTSCSAEMGWCGCTACRLAPVPPTRLGPYPATDQLSCSRTFPLHPSPLGCCFRPTTPPPPIPTRSSRVHRSAPPSAAEVLPAVPPASPGQELPGDALDPGGECPRPPGAPPGGDQGVGRVQGLHRRARVRRRGRQQEGGGWRQEEGGGEGVRAGGRDAADRVGAEGDRPQGLRPQGLRSQGIGAARAGGRPDGVDAACARREAGGFRSCGGEERGEVFQPFPLVTVGRVVVASADRCRGVFCGCGYTVPWEREVHRAVDVRGSFRC